MAPFGTARSSRSTTLRPPKNRDSFSVAMTVSIVKLLCVFVAAAPPVCPFCSAAREVRRHVCLSMSPPVDPRQLLFHQPADLLRSQGAGRRLAQGLANPPADDVL